MPVKKPTQTAAKATPSKSNPAPAAKPSTPTTKRSAVKRPLAASAVSTKPAVTAAVIPPPAAVPLQSTAPALRPGSKQAQLLTLLQSGATMPQMVQTTGWQTHTVRATISAVFRKRLGMSVQCRQDGTTRVYRIAPFAA